MSDLSRESLFKKFYLESYSGIYYYALSRTGNSETAKDLVEDAFANIWTNFDALNHDTLRQYLYAYTRNKCVDYFRHSIVERKMVSAMLKMDEADGEELYKEREENIRRVGAIARNLPDRTRVVVYKCFIEQKKYKEVANELGITINAVKKHIVNALKAFREDLLKE
jgi:RNA polymerase sigma-70 factor (ECF subfamily)